MAAVHGICIQADTTHKHTKRRVLLPQRGNAQTFFFLAGCLQCVKRRVVVYVLMEISIKNYISRGIAARLHSDRVNNKSVVRVYIHTDCCGQKEQ